MGQIMIIDGKGLAQSVQQGIKETVAQISGRRPCLAVILVGEHPPSVVYISRKMSSCLSVGITSQKVDLPVTVTEEELLAEIHKLNTNPDVDGILVQLPLPPHISFSKVAQAIDPSKDVDGFHPINMGKLLMGSHEGFVPCTPLGIKHLLLSTGESISGKNAVILGRSNIVGKPMGALLLQNTPELNATVTIAHSHTKNIKDLCLHADIIIAAMGRPFFLKEDMVKQGAIVIDVGINKIEDAAVKGGFRLVGDVDFANVQKKCAFITPVPGGVGPMTIAMLLSNTLLSFQRRNKK